MRRLWADFEWVEIVHWSSYFEGLEEGVGGGIHHAHPEFVDFVMDERKETLVCEIIVIYQSKTIMPPTISLICLVNVAERRLYSLSSTWLREIFVPLVSKF